MTNRRRCVAVVVLAAFLQAAGYAAAQTSVSGAIEGVVTSARDVPMANATIRIESRALGATTTTGANGSFAIADLPPETYTLEVLGPAGLVLAATRVRLASGATVTVTIGTSSAASPDAAVAAVENPRFRVGPVGVTPSVSLVNAGLDTNVLNEVEPSRGDGTLTIAPQAGIGVRAGRVLANGVVRSEYAHFQRYASERALSHASETRVEVAAGRRLTPWAALATQGGRWRAGHEIDVRPNRSTSELRLGVDHEVTPQTTVRVALGRGTDRYDSGQSFLGSDLQQRLNRQTYSIGLDASRVLTGALAAALEVEARSDRFQFDAARNADSTAVRGRVDVDFDDWLTGRFRLGYRKLDGVGTAIADDRGLVGSLDAAVILWGRTRIDLSGQRDFTYSADAFRPYYIGTGGTLLVTHLLTGRWEARAQAGGDRLNYRPALDAEVDRRTDRYAFSGGGIGFFVRRDVRIGFDLTREQRESVEHTRDFVGYRIGTSMTVGVPPAGRLIRPWR